MGRGTWMEPKVELKLDESVLSPHQQGGQYSGLVSVIQTAKRHFKARDEEKEKKQATLIGPRCPNPEVKKISLRVSCQGNVRKETLEDK